VKWGKDKPGKGRPNKADQKGVEQMLEAMDAEPIGDKRYDMTKAVQKEKNKGKGKK
jgi:hypothetical protein